MKLHNALSRLVKLYLRDVVAASAIAFGLMFPVIVGATGVSVDLARAHLVRERLLNALDAAALAAASAGGTENEMEGVFEAFFEANYPPEKIGTAYDLDLDVDGDDILVSASASVDTSFMKVFGRDSVEVSAASTVHREVRGLEVVLVLDNTGSMYGSNIAALKTASESFVDILFEATSEPENIKIGLVPYSTSVNVGPYGLGEDMNGDYYGDAFVNNPYGYDYNPNSYYEWHGCVLAEDYPEDTRDDFSGNWDMYRWDVSGCPYYYYYCRPTNNPNYICPDSPIVPMTSDQDELIDAIDDMSADGYTLGNYGMVWGWRTISPEAPFTEGAAYDDERWRKAVIMMTDGNNTMHWAYTAYGKSWDNSISPTTLNNRFADICENMKDEGIMIYTVTFTSGISEGTKNYYRECATDETKYYDAPSQDDLVEVFENISRELSNLHIKN